MIDSPGRFLYLIPGLLSITYALVALLRGKALGLESRWGLGTRTFTPEDIFSFPFSISIFIMFGVLFTLLGSEHRGVLTTPYLALTGEWALIARIIVLWLVSYAVVFFLSQVRRFITGR